MTLCDSVRLHLPRVMRLSVSLIGGCDTHVDRYTSDSIIKIVFPLSSFAPIYLNRKSV